MILTSNRHGEIEIILINFPMGFTGVSMEFSTLTRSL